MFWKRLLSAIVLIPVLILVIYWDSLFYPILVFAVVVVMLAEFGQLTRSIGSKSYKATLFLSALPFCLSAQFGFSVALAFAFTLVVSFAAEIFRRQVDDVFLSVSSTITGSIYVGWAFGYHLLLLRQFDEQVGSKLGLLPPRDGLVRRQRSIPHREQLGQAQAVPCYQPQ